MVQAEPVSQAAISQSDKDHSAIPEWGLGPFVRDDGADRLGPIGTTEFKCPVSGQAVKWEAKDLLCAAAVVKDGKVYMFYRAEDSSRPNSWGTSRIGLAISEDGRHFLRQPEPVLYPTKDSCEKYEWPGGCQDARVCASEDGTFIMTYTAYDGKKARLFVATSKDLFKWEKKGSAFAKFKNGKYLDVWSKSGAIVTTRKADQFVATKINGKYWMYFGEDGAILASSDNLVDWDVVETAEGKPLIVLPKRPGNLDDMVTEPGPPAFLTDKGIYLMYNCGAATRPDLGLKRVWSVGQALFDARDPSKVIGRTNKDFFHPERDFELKRKGKPEEGAANVTFVSSLVWFKGEWRFYYGCADSWVASAFCRP